jgi:hypothetical protein
MPIGGALVLLMLESPAQVLVAALVAIVLLLPLVGFVILVAAALKYLTRRRE